MEETADRAIAIVGVGSVLPDAHNTAAFWENLTTGKYSITEVTPDRWDPLQYYHQDPHAPEKSYSKIGGWVRSAPWDPIAWKLPIPPKVADAMDGGQKWAVACTREALLDYGAPERPIDRMRTAVILGNAMAGEKHYLTALRVFFPEYAKALSNAPSFASLPSHVRNAVIEEARALFGDALPPITEDTMPGELSNCIAGRIANLFDLHGPNYTVDAACASAVAAVSAAIEGLTERDFDVAITGGIDRNMGPSAFVKFSKIGALSATGTRPYADGADGFVMGEGAAVFILKRLADAERDGDKIYAVIRGIGGSSDGKGKGITAPNPVGQKLAVERAWDNARISPSTCSLLEGHGTSTRVGDVVEVQALSEVFGAAGVQPGAIPLGSVKSNIGHLKAAAGAAGLLKVALALHHKQIPPSLGFEKPNPNINFSAAPFFVPTSLRPWETPSSGVRRAGLSAFGFGGTNFHAVIEEHEPGRLTRSKTTVGVHTAVGAAAGAAAAAKSPLRGALVLGGRSAEAVAQALIKVAADAKNGKAPPPTPPSAVDLTAPFRIAIDYGDAAELAEKSAKALKAFQSGDAAAFRMLRAQGIFVGTGQPGKVAFLYTGQGSQYVGMLQHLRRVEPIVAGVFSEADKVMTPLLGRPLSRFIFVESGDPAAKARAEDDLKQTAITQPAILATDIALTRLLAAYGVFPHMVMGHSLGEYGALVASGALPFADALEAVSARGREMTKVSVQDNGAMVAVTAPIEEIQKVIQSTQGYVVIANLNSKSQAVIGGATQAVLEATAQLQQKGFNCVQLPVSHAFHTSIVAPASGPLRAVLERLHVSPPRIPIVANVTGQLYPMHPNARPEIVDLLSKQVAAPVEFVKGLETLYAQGARVFVEVGPKKALAGFVEDVLVPRGDVVALATNHPKTGDLVSFNQALCALYAAGLGLPVHAPESGVQATSAAAASTVKSTQIQPERTMPTDNPNLPSPNTLSKPLDVVITGAALGLPGTSHVFDDSNLEKILRGDDFIDVVPTRFRRGMLDKHVTRVVKSEDGSGSFQTIDNPDNVIRLAARAGAFDLIRDHGVSADRVAALDLVTQLAMAAGIDALRDAGIPLVRHYKVTTKGTKLPDRWGLPDALRDDTGIVFASAFPGYDAFADDLTRYYQSVARREQIAMLDAIQERLGSAISPDVLADLNYRRSTLQAAEAREPYVFDRRFLFRILAMGHSQFAEFIGARGPNTAVNSACASTTQAVSVAQDWIRAGRCRRVIIVAADDVTSDRLLEWIGAGFLSTGAAATDDVVERAALPFDRRRHGMLLGMGAAAIVVESREAAAERGVLPICKVLGTVTANSAFHGTRLDVNHITQVMESLVKQAESQGVPRHILAQNLLFVSHETYTPARGGSASAEIFALRTVFGNDVSKIVIANTKGFTGHPMGVGIEDVIAVKALETGIVPPVPNFHEVDPELGELHLSRGGPYPIKYALRLGAGFGSQISMTLLEWTPSHQGSRPAVSNLGFTYRVADPIHFQTWLSQVTGGPAQLEVVQRTLRVKDGTPAKTEVSQPVATPVAMPSPSPATPATVVKAPEPQRAPVPVVEAPAAKPAPSPAAAPAPNAGAAVSFSEQVKAKVLDVVAAQTGYPRDMLDMDLDLEADLGIDTVKQAETFAAVRTAYDIPRDDKLRLRDFPTLGHVVQFVLDRRPDLASTQTPSAPAAPSTPSAPDAPAATPASPSAQTGSTSFADEVRAKVLDVVAAQTGYPRDMLDMDLDLEADLGIDTVKQAETFAAVRTAYDIPRDDKLRLRDFPTLGHVVQFVLDRRPDLASTQTPSTPAAPSAPSAPDAPAATPASPSAQTGSTSFADEVKAKVLDVVAAQTGYPRDMLDMDLDLEADLGIDTVKQAETFAAVRTAYDIPRDDKLRLRDFPTLGHVVQFVLDRRPDLASTQTPSAPAAPSTPSAPDAPAATPTSIGSAPSRGLPFDAINQLPRRVPQVRLRPNLTVCKPTGVVLNSNSRVVIAADRGGVAQALGDALSQQGVHVLTLPSGLSTQELLAQIEAFSASGPIQGVYWLPATDVEPTQSTLTEWRESLRIRVKLLAETMRHLYSAVSTHGTFLVAATRLGGCHGYDPNGAVAPLGGAVTGFVKAYKREREAVLVKAVDFPLSQTPEEVANHLIAETLSDPGAVEVGIAGDRRVTIALEETPVPTFSSIPALNAQSVVVVSGAAGSIVSAITADLAARSGATFYLLDLAPPPDSSDPDLARFSTDRDGLKRDLFERQKSRGERATPASVEKELAVIERRAAALAAVQAIQKAGGQAHYRSVNLTDAEAVASALSDVRSAGKVSLLLHAAGLEISRFLPDKTQAEYDRVFDVKADGWYSLMSGLEGVALETVMVFSSIAGRFGNGGQTDYSAANDLLCKLVSSFRNRMPATRGIAVDWTAWSSIGMASRGSIPKMMELAGIDMLPPEAGIPAVYREIAAEGQGGEVLIGGKLGLLFNENDDTGGLLPGLPQSVLPMVDRVQTMGVHIPLTAVARLEPSAENFLQHHRINGTPVLPGVMGIEAFVEVSGLPWPGSQPLVVRDVQFAAPFKFYRDEPRDLTIQAVARMVGGREVVECKLLGSRSLVGRAEPQWTVHFLGIVLLGNPASHATAPEAIALPNRPADRTSADIYLDYFHGPAYRVLAEAWVDDKVAYGRMATDLPPNQSSNRGQTVFYPRMIELCFQTAGIWEMKHTGKMGLPARVDEIQLLRSPSVGPMIARIQAQPNGTFHAQVADETGVPWLTLQGYRTISLSDSTAA
ncbi:MAG: SDR family NAD(P)-dependent oxidoreductase [Polyangiaceae bacterium]|nr:SDR family NAD(P)-dependent oxidoreductase [Polyangiaceae bacterium]